MLIISDVGLDHAVVERAIAEASAASAELLVLAVLDPARPATIATKICETGQVGARPSEDFRDTLFDRHEKLILEEGNDIVAEARDRGLVCRLEVARGTYACETQEAMRRETPGCVVIQKRRRSLLRFVAQDRFLDELSKEKGFRLIEV